MFVSMGEGTRFVTDHDERGAPFVLNRFGIEDTSRIVSLADEHELTAGIVLELSEGSPIVGVGIDLCATDDFTDTPSNDRFCRRLFSDAELTLAAQGIFGPNEMGRAWLFSIHEAAFKATSQAVRAWYEQDHCAPSIHFTIRDFTVTNPHDATPCARAVPALEKLSIGRIVTESAPFHGMALTIALAFKGGSDSCFA